MKSDYWVKHLKDNNDHNCPINELFKLLKKNRSKIYLFLDFGKVYFSSYLWTILSLLIALIWEIFTVFDTESYKEDLNI